MPKEKGLGDLERQVMDFLWSSGPSTGDAIRAAISKDKPLADSTIRTVLRRLEAKQYVRHELDGRQFVYASSREPRKAAAEAIRGVLKTFCRGSLEELLTGLVDHRVVDPTELRRIAARIDALDKSKGGRRKP